MSPKSQSQINSYKEYYDKLIRMAKSSYHDVEDNEDCGHNSMVISAILDTSRSVEMLCGEMSAFRESLYNHLKGDLVAKGYTDQEATDVADWTKGKVIQSLSAFLDKHESRINIYVLDRDTDFLNGVLLKDKMKTAIEQEKLQIFYLEKNNRFLDDLGIRDKIQHVTIGDNMLRLELDKKEHTASVEINADEQAVGMLTTAYAALRSGFDRVEASQLN